MASLAAAGPPATLRRRCLQVVAWALLKRRVQAGGCGGSSASSLEEGVRALPQELQLELLLLAASWQLLDDAACTLLTCGAADSGSSSSSILAGAATVSLAHCVLLGGASLRRLFCCPLPQLQTLSLRGLPQLTDAHVALVAKQCPSLTRLDFSKCLELTGAAVAAVAAGACAPQLQALSLVGCWQVAALPGLALRCTGLASLDVSGCWQLAEGELQEVRESRGRGALWRAFPASAAYPAPSVLCADPGRPAAARGAEFERLQAPGRRRLHLRLAAALAGRRPGSGAAPRAAAEGVGSCGSGAAAAGGGAGGCARRQYRLLGPVSRGRRCAI